MTDKARETPLSEGARWLEEQFEAHWREHGVVRDLNGELVLETIGYSFNERWQRVVRRTHVPRRLAEYLYLVGGESARWPVPTRSRVLSRYDAWARPRARSAP